jgi:hypothetical protein
MAGYATHAPFGLRTIGYKCSSSEREPTLIYGFDTGVRLLLSSMP